MNSIHWIIKKDIGLYILFRTFQVNFQHISVTPNILMTHYSAEVRTVYVQKKPIHVHCCIYNFSSSSMKAYNDFKTVGYLYKKKFTIFNFMVYSTQYMYWNKLNNFVKDMLILTGNLIEHENDTFSYISIR